MVFNRPKCLALAQATEYLHMAAIESTTYTNSKSCVTILISNPQRIRNSKHCAVLMYRPTKIERYFNGTNFSRTGFAKAQPNPTSQLFQLAFNHKHASLLINAPYWYVDSESNLAWQFEVLLAYIYPIKLSNLTISNPFFGHIIYKDKNVWIPKSEPYTQKERTYPTTQAVLPANKYT